MREYKEDDGVLEVPVQCASCFQLYVARYFSYSDLAEVEPGDWSGDPLFIGTVPAVVAPTLPSKTIMTISPSFSKIYDETAAAELAGLTELLGAGYRRALEALVKEYLIFKNPAETEVYKKTALGNCIKHHIDEETRRLENSLSRQSVSETISRISITVANTKSPT